MDTAVETVLGLGELEAITHDWDSLFILAGTTRCCGTGTCGDEDDILWSHIFTALPNDEQRDQLQWERALSVRSIFGDLRAA